MIHLTPYDQLLGGLILALTLIIDLITDYRLWVKHKPVHHVRGAALRLIGIIPAVLLSRWVILWLLPLYGVLFNGFFGLLIARDWFFIGTTGKIDRFKNAHPWFILVEYFVAAGGIAFYLSRVL